MKAKSHAKLSVYAKLLLAVFMLQSLLNPAGCSTSAGHLQPQHTASLGSACFSLIFSFSKPDLGSVAPWWPVYSGLHARAGAGGCLPLPDGLRTLLLLLAQGRLWPVPCLPGERLSPGPAPLRAPPDSAHQRRARPSPPHCLSQVLFRLNFLVLVLCVVMDRPYQFYYFVPLVTFWFVVIYATLASWPQVLQKQANGTLFSGKFLCLQGETFVAKFLCPL